jgi:hypothetical protein
MNHASTGEPDEYFTKQTNKYENASAPQPPLNAADQMSRRMTTEITG